VGLTVRVSVSMPPSNWLENDSVALPVPVLVCVSTSV
jgi:hypothetical protein